MSVMLNFKLCHGKIFEAGRAGKHICNIALAQIVISFRIRRPNSRINCIKAARAVLAIVCHPKAPVDSTYASKVSITVILQGGATFPVHTHT